MTRTQILAQMQVLAEEQTNEKLLFTESLSLQEGLGVDSIAVMEYIISLEDNFGMDIPDEVLDHVQTVGQLADYITEKLA
ncbi:phosphopantetheine-binding protein [Streptococcus sp. DD12]|uniref:phosphopantetheine-binding protein n=1 Tax=Streptococcus sp. DD12 TaxID=1777880 RepID=UPI0007951C2E|nr:phosphopantetheine-binding protein [Streptococcus sp. DD12]KXT75304.1 Acyl carrier protein [Streptococcus sp. DD12]